MKTKVLTLTILLTLFCCCAWYQLPPDPGPVSQLQTQTPTSETGILPDLIPVSGQTDAPAAAEAEEVSDETEGALLSAESDAKGADADAHSSDTAEPGTAQVSDIIGPDAVRSSDSAEGDMNKPGSDQLQTGQNTEKENVNPTLIPTVLSPEPTPTETEEKTGKSGSGFAKAILVLICAAAVGVGGLSAFNLYKNRKNVNNSKQRPYRSKESVTTVVITRTGPYVCAGCVGQGKRNYQEDSYWYGTEIGPERAVCVMIADGMGGMDNGAESSSIAAKRFDAAVPQIETDRDIPSRLWELCRSINSEIYSVNSMKGMNGGSTLVSAYIIDNRLYWISIGDSRIYLLREGVLSSVSEEHELESRMYGELLEDEIDLEEIRSTPNSELRKLTSNLGRSEIPLIDQNYSPYHLRCGDKLLLCSDGVSGTLSEQELIQCLYSPDPEINCKLISELIEHKDKPHQDNYSAVVIYCATEEGK